MCMVQFQYKPLRDNESCYFMSIKLTTGPDLPQAAFVIGPTGTDSALHNNNINKNKRVRLTLTRVVHLLYGSTVFNLALVLCMQEVTNIYISN